MKSIRYSVAVIALLVAVSLHTAPAQALTNEGAVNKIGGALFNQTVEERAVTNLERSIAQKQRAKEKLQAQLAASYLGVDGLTSQLGSGQSTIDELNRRLLEDSPNMTSQEFQATLNELNRAKSRFVTLGREAKWAQHRQAFLLREIERKDQDIASLQDRLTVARPLADQSRGQALVDTVKDIALDKAREVERTQRNDAYVAAREAQRDSERRTSVGYVYESIQRKEGTVSANAGPYSRASGTARTRQGGGGTDAGTGGNYALDFSQQ